MGTAALFGRRVHGLPQDLAPEAGSGRFFQLLDLVDRNAGQFGDLLDKVDPSYDEADLSVLVFLARVVGDSHEAFEVQVRFVRVGDADVIGRPTNAAGEVGDFDRRLAVHFALHVPVKHLRLVVGKGRVGHGQLVGRVRNRNSTEVGSISVLAQLNCSGLEPSLNVTLRVSRTSVRSSEL